MRMVHLFCVLATIKLHLVLSRTYLAHHELESDFIIIIIITIIIIIIIIIIKLHLVNKTIQCVQCLTTLTSPMTDSAMPANQC